LRERGPDERRRALGDAQLEARQLADRQRQLAEGAAAASKRNDTDARRRTAGEQQRLAERVEALQKRLRELGASGTDGAERERLTGAARDLENGRTAARMRELAQGPQQGKDSERAEAGRELARSLDRLADQLAGSVAKGDREGRQLSDDLSRTRELRERLSELQRQMGELGRDSNAGDNGRAGTRPGGEESGQSGTPRQQGQQAGSRPGSSGQSGSQVGSASSREGGEPSTQSAEARARQLGALRRRYLEELQRAGELDGRIRQVAPGTSGLGSTPVGQAMVSAAPGTEAFKQDFAKWEDLHREVTLGLERLESGLSQRVIEKAAKDRLRSGSTDRTPPDYSSSVDRYFRALAQEPR
jgi:hypothetical protein